MTKYRETPPDEQPFHPIDEHDDMMPFDPQDPGPTEPDFTPAPRPPTRSYRRPDDPDPEFFRTQCQVVRETGKAYLMDLYLEDGRVLREVWLPKSQVTLDGTVHGADFVEIPEWLADKKDLL